MELFITHTDLDGYGCAVLEKFLPASDTNRVIVSVNYGDQLDAIIEELPKNKEIDTLWFTDISPNQNHLDKFIRPLVEQNILKKVYVYDHHSTALFLKDEPIITGEIRTSSCGTKILFENLIEQFSQKNYHDRFWDQGYNPIIRPTNEEVFRERLKEFVDVVNDYDMWIKDIEYSTGLSDLSKILGFSTFVKMITTWLLETDHEHQLWDFITSYGIPAGSILQHNNANKIKYMASINEKIEIEQIPINKDQNDNKFVIIFSSKHHSELGNSIVTKFNEEHQLGPIDYVLMVNMETKSVSARSTTQVNVAEIMKTYGGGGHPQAAGCSLNSTFVDSSYMSALMRSI